MKTILLFIIALTCALNTYSQKRDTLYLDATFQETDKNMAVYKRVLSPNKTIKKKSVIYDYYPDGETFCISIFSSKTTKKVTLDNYTEIHAKKVL